VNWRGRNIYLVGLPGAGKSAIGKELAPLLQRHHYEFIDLDEAIEEASQQTIPEIFSSTNGEQSFREFESQSLLRIAEEGLNGFPSIVATGGGTVLSPLNRRVMRGSGVIVWIDVSIKEASKNVLKSMMQGKVRPLLKSESLEELEVKVRGLAEARNRYYEEATLHFVTRSPRGDERTPQELAEELYNALQQMSKRVRMKPRFHTFNAKSALQDYPIAIGSGIAVNELVKAIDDLGSKTIAIVTDSNVAKHQTNKLISKLTPLLSKDTSLYQILIEPGEASKNRETAFEILDYFNNIDLPRKQGLVIGIGGGVVTDIAGFSASIYKRGIPFIAVPTTLLAQVDAAIGGKTGIDYGGAKNAIGTFYPPIVNITDPLFLKTLPKREVHAGLAEVFKYALIGNSELWKELSKSVRRLVRGVDASYEALIRECVAEKLQYVEEDEFERASGIRELLNFGHTFGHALESATEYKSFLHGEAVALGMRAASFLSCELGLLSESEWREIEITLGRIPIEGASAISTEAIYNAMRQDKKRLDKGNRFILLKQIGEAVVVENVPEEKIRQSIEFMLSLA